MSVARYPAYRDSGVEWLGEVPAHWRVQRLRTVALLNPSKSELRDWDRQITVSFLPMEAIGEDGTLDLSRERPMAELEAGYSYVRDGDVAIAKITPCFENGKGAVMRGLRGGVGFGTTELIVVRPDADRVSAPFLHYLFNSRQFRGLGEAHMYGAGGQQRVPDDFVRNFVAPLPPRAEQDEIVAFLDDETLKLDGLVAEQQRLIAVLMEKRQALIATAVARGLDAGVPLQATDNAWLGEIPAHWSLERIKRVARMESGHTPDKKIEAYWQDCDIPWVSLNDTGYLRTHDYISETTNNVNALGIANSSARILPAGTVVFSRDATIGRCAITTRPMAVSQHFIAWVCGDRILPEYLLLRLRSMTPELERLTFGATVRTIGMPDVKTLVTPVPPRDEQARIVAHVRRATTWIDSLVADAERAIDLLQERRTALISAAVSGQINVRAHARAEEAVAA